MTIRLANTGIEKIDATIDYAEQMWAALDRRGYGGAKKGTERATEDYYGKLLPSQKEDFDRFWKAFRKTDGKQGAVQSWLKLDPDKELAEKIIKGAQKEAQARSTKGNTPIWAQGWLSNRRWEDYDLDEPKTKTNSDHLEILSKLNHAKTMLERDPENEYWISQINKYNEMLIHK